MVRTYRVAALAVAMALAALQPPAAAAAQTAQPATIEAFAGAWEGSAQTPNGDVSLRAAFKVQDGKLGGTIESAMGQITVVTSTFADGKLTITIELQGGTGTLACQLTGNRIEGTWSTAMTPGPSGWHGPGRGRRKRRRPHQRDLGRRGRHRRPDHAVLDGPAGDRRHGGGRDDLGDGEGAAHERQLERRRPADGVPIHGRSPW